MKSAHSIKLVLLLLAASGFRLSAQTLYIPGGASTGIGSSSTGNVGIGTSAPIGKLHVSSASSGISPMVMSGGFFPQFPLTLATISGTNTVNSSSAIVGLDLENTSATTGSYSPLIVFSRKSDSSNYKPAFAAIGGLNLGIGPNGDWSAGALTLWTAGSSTFGPVERVRIDQNGNVGIGTVSPATKLHVNGGVLLGSSASAVTTGFRGEFGDPNAAGTGGFRFNRNTATAGDKVLSSFHSNSGQEFYHEVLTVDTSQFIFWGGNVGIGTRNPTQKLSVNGTIRAKEVIVDTGWSDYVFSPDYKLAPLSEVETHIKENGHLPGIPSAKEVAEHGVSMGEMQAKLLAKIEELTLHQIEQEKNIAELRERALRQDQEIQALRAGK